VIAVKRHRGLLALLALGVALTAHAGNTYDMKVVPFAQPTPPAADETLVYVIREKSGFGGMQKFAVIDNDTVVGVLVPGSFTWFKMPSGEHEIVGYVSPSPLVHHRLMPAPGQTVYLYIKVGYTTGLFMSPLPEAEAKALMAEYKFTEIGIKGKKAKMDYKAYYDKLFQ
jgi:hypothetical protein